MKNSPYYCPGRGANPRPPSRTPRLHNKQGVPHPTSSAIVMFVEVQTHGFTAQSFGFKGRLLNHIVGLLLDWHQAQTAMHTAMHLCIAVWAWYQSSLLPKQIIAIIHDLMLNCFPVVTYVIVCGFISNIKQK